MRKAVLILVLVLHGGFFLLFTLPRGRSPLPAQTETPSLTLLLIQTSTPPDITARRPTANVRESKRKHSNTPASRSLAASAPREPEAESQLGTAPAPDWYGELQIAANNQIERAEQRRRAPSALAPHDFSGVKPGSTDDSRPEFGWDHSVTHRVQDLPGGGWLININEHCAIAIVLMIMPVCTFGKIPARGDLFDHMQDAPEAAR